MRNSHRFTRLAAALATGIILPSLVAPLVLGTGVAQAAPESGTYTVNSGDSLYGLARRMGVSLDELLATNGLTLNSLILPGRVLVVPAGGTVPTAPSTAGASTSRAAAPAARTSGPVESGQGGAPAGSYTIKSGDYFYAIARRHGVSLDALLAANNLTLSSIVHPGATITIPAGGRPPASASAGAAPTATPIATGTSAPAVGGAPASSYTVRRGDGFFGIASRHGVSLNALLEANDLTIHSIVHPGSTITIPAGGRIINAPATATSSTPATASTPTTAPAAPTVGASNSSKADAVVAFAWAQLGKPYQFAAAGPDAFDCSGLTTAAYRQVGVWLPQQSGLQSTRGTAVDWTTEEIRPGDLVFTIRSGTSSIGHVGIAISSTQWIHAPRAGDVVKLGTIPADARIAAVRRFV